MDTVFSHIEDMSDVVRFVKEVQVPEGMSSQYEHPSIDEALELYSSRFLKSE
jgi:predicted transcriptional regulator YdeE